MNEKECHPQNRLINTITDELELSASTSSSRCCASNACSKNAECAGPKFDLIFAVNCQLLAHTPADTRTSPPSLMWPQRIVVLTCYTSVLAEALSLKPLPNNVRIRQGKSSDELPIAITMAKELMNPLGISHKNNLLVACDIQNSRQLIGWAQIRSMGFVGPSIADSKTFEDGDNTSNVSTMQSRFSIEQEVDDIMWEEFEDDPTPIPTGLASLPWTEEYRVASRAADQRVARRKEVLQMELEDAPKLWELSSVYVIPEYRRRGVGSELVRQVLTRQYAQNKQGKDVYALTLAKNVEWYKQFGFKIEEQVPDFMKLEMTAGKVITKLIGEELVCIRTQL